MHTVGQTWPRVRAGRYRMSSLGVRFFCPTLWSQSLARFYMEILKYDMVYTYAYVYAFVYVYV